MRLPSTTVPGGLLFIALLSAAPALAQEHSHDTHEIRPTMAQAHPAPRTGVSARDVLAMPGQPPRLAGAYRMAAEIPHVLDGIRCPCGCSDKHGHYSLLSCFGEGELASSCGICRDAARLAYQLHQEGNGLDEIRSAIDAKYSGR